MKSTFTLLLSTFFCIPTLFAQTLDIGLQAHFKFDNDLFDETINAHDLISNSGTVSYSTVNPGDQCLNLDGASNITSIDIYNNTAYTAGAVSLWFKAPGITNQFQTIYQGAFIGNAIYIQGNTGKLIGFFSGNSVGAYVSTISITDNAWHHVVIQNNGSRTYMYIDGVLDGSQSESLVVGNGSSNNRLFFGKTNQNAYPFTGSVNEARIYDRMLTICEIHELYGQGTLPKAHFSFENSLDDVSGNNEDLSSTGSLVSYVSSPVSVNTALALNGTNVMSSTVPFDNSNYDEISVSVWMKTSNIIADHQVVVQGAFLGFALYLEPSTGKIIGFMDGSMVNGYVSSISVSDGVWHHIVLKSNGTTTSMYIDGVLDGQITENLVLGDGTSNNRIFLGETNQGAYPFTGFVDELMIFDRALVDCEIEELSTPTSNVSVAEAELQAMAMNAYPNPSNGNFNVDMGNKYTDVKVKVIDLNGKIVQNQYYGEVQLLNINIEAAPGIYFLQITSGSTQGFVKVIKQ